MQLSVKIHVLYAAFLVLFQLDFSIMILVQYSEVQCGIKRVTVRVNSKWR